METETVERLQARIEEIKRILSDLGEMRPGSLSEQYNVCGNPHCRCKDPENPRRHGPYFQLSYTHKGRSRSEFVRKQDVEEMRRRIANYRTFKELSAEWVDLSIRIGKLKKSCGT